MYELIVLLLEEGVLGLAREISDGIECTYYLEGISFTITCEPGEYHIIQEL